MNQQILPPAIDCNALPGKWCMGLPLGNGRVGVMCWHDKNELRFTLDHCDAWDLRHSDENLHFEDYPYQKLVKMVEAEEFDKLEKESAGRIQENPIGPTKIYLGRFNFKFKFDKVTDFKLDLAEAAVSMQAGKHSAEAFVAKDKDIFSFRLDSCPDEFELEYLPFYETTPRLAELGNPEIEINEMDGLKTALQKILPDKYFAICWNDKGPEFFVTFAYSKDKETALKEAQELHPSHTDDKYNSLLNAHTDAWNEFWNRCAIALPEKDLETLWYFGLYMLSASAEKGRTPPGLQGLWAMDGRTAPWRGDYVADMNVQEYFRSACPANHIDLLDCWLEYSHKYLPKTREYTEKMFGTAGAFQLSHYLPEYTPILSASWAPLNFAWSHTGWLTLLAWLRWRYTLDIKWLEDIGYELTASAFEFFAANLAKEADGKYHIPLSRNPEYKEGSYKEGWGKDPNIDIALIRKCCGWIIEMEKALNISTFSEKASEIHDNLAQYYLLEFDPESRYNFPVSGPYILGVWKNKLLDDPHRHPSHLMAIYPAMDITIDGGEEERKIIEASLNHYFTLGQYRWAGHTYAQMTSFGAVTGFTDFAYNCLCRYRDNWILPNRLHFNRTVGNKGDSWFSLDSINDFDKDGQFTVNESCAITGGICDMLVQGWGDKLRIFPAVPSRWQDLLFK
ncbi:MAG: glycosyl hydrolase family 95 catalytic domain-containing protein, partial [Planctomycetota bacterium]